MRVLAGFVAAIFVLFTLFLLVTLNAAHVLTDRDAIKAAIDTDVVASLVVDAASTAVRQFAASRGVPAGEVEPAIVETALTTLLPPGWLDAQTGRTVDAVVDFLETGNENNLRIRVDVSELLPRFSGQPGLVTLTQVLETLPPCPDTVPPVDLATGRIEIVNCMPRGIEPAVAAALIQPTLVTNVINSGVLIDGRFIDVDLGSTLNATPEQREQFQTWRARLLRVRRFGPLLWFFPVFCLGLIVLLAVRSMGSFGRWWGWPLVVAGAAALLLAFAAWLGWEIAANTAADAAGNAGPTLLSVVELADTLIGQLLREWGVRVSIRGALLFLLGVLLLALAALADVFRNRPVAPIDLR